MVYCLGAALVIIAALLIKVHLMHRAADEISGALGEIRAQGSGTLIGISSRDRYMRALAASLNTELKELNALRLRYEHGDREIKNAVTGVSHDLRTPLTAITGYLKLLENERDEEKRARYISVIKNRVEALTRLCEELFDFSLSATAEQPLELEPVPLKGALEESLAAFYQTFTKKGIVPTVQLPEEPVVCMANPEALSRVLGNILGNAAKYSDGDLAVSLDGNGVLRFENGAAGLDSVQTEKLFDRFYTVENVRSSTGLGLSIAKTLTERMGGKIEAEYRSGRLSILIKLKKETN